MGYEDEIGAVAADVHATSCEKGWWPEKNNDPHTPLTDPRPNDVLAKLFLVVTEAAESGEIVRDPNRTIHDVWDESMPEGTSMTLQKYAQHQQERIAKGLPLFKPQGFVIEKADEVIRIFDLCEAYGQDIEMGINVKRIYNKTRSTRHGNKRA